MPGWDGFDIVSPLSATFNTPVYVDNDANYAAYCESRMGAAIGKRDFVYISTNDNVGAGIVAGGEIMHGVTGLAGEIRSVRSAPAAIADASTPLSLRTGWCNCSASRTAT